jgi:hypothetical protein
MDESKNIRNNNKSFLSFSQRIWNLKINIIKLLLIIEILFNYFVQIINFRNLI